MTHPAPSPAAAVVPDRHARPWLVAWGALLGLSLLKFGNPVVLDRQIPVPASMAEAFADPWPVRWALVLGALLLIAGGGIAWRSLMARCARLPVLLWLAPSLWLGWQFLSTAQSEDRSLSFGTLAQFGGIAGAYAAGIAFITDRRRLTWVLAGVLAGFCICLMRAVNQRTEFPQVRAALIEGERTGWTNFPPAAVRDLERQQLIIVTNGLRVANPLILIKLDRGRVHGTLVYPNALAGAVLLLLPALWVLVREWTLPARPITQFAATGLLLLLGMVALAWSGSKSGWLIALMMIGALGLRLPLPLPPWWRRVAVAAVAAAGLLVFALRFQDYFSAGATSVGARFDYWRSAVHTTLDEPWLGTGPGTFQRSYAARKSPESEMARLAHNDYLEQFSDSGVAGGILYLAWIGGWVWVSARRAWTGSDPLVLAAALGATAWFAQGLSEFSLYVPALAWTAFTLAGAVTVLTTLTAPETSPTATPLPSAPRTS